MSVVTRVKSVLSGDTVVLQSAQVAPGTTFDHPSNPKQERALSLAYVSAPRTRRDAGDEPFAFESRDFLRKLLVGRAVQFHVLYKVPGGSGEREYGLLRLPNGGPELPELALAEGWVKLRDDASRRDDSEAGVSRLQKLEAAQAHARADSKGVWQETGGRIEIEYELHDARGFAEAWKGKKMDAIVEKVLSGDRVIARLMPKPTEHVQTIVLIAGIRAPSLQRTDPATGQQTQAAEPFAEAAQQFAENRLLQRNVVITIHGVSPQGQLIATLAHPQHGSIAPFLLRDGLVRCFDPHSTLLGSEMGPLRQAQRYAQDNRRGLFQNHAPARTTASNELEAVVSRVQSADTLYLRHKAGQERRVNLSSVRQPKPTDPAQAPWGAEAKEFLRKRLIGKHVKFSIDGKRPATEGYDEREMATVTYNGKNIGMLLVENGYASVIRHRADDTDRSPLYDDLLLAEQQAQEQGRGMWAAKPPAAKQYVDYSESLEKAKRQLSLLSRQKKVPAIVDFVKSGSRFTVLVPRDNAKMTFVLSGIRAPKVGRNPNEPSEPCGQEAFDFANRRCLQRDVEIDVDDTDKVGGFIGTLYVNRENFAKLLVEEGLAYVHAYSAEKSGNANELFAAEQRAKEARKGLWKDWTPEADQDAGATNGDTSDHAAAANGDATAGAPRQVDYRDVVVTHVDEAGRLKLQQIGKGTAALTELMQAFRSFHLNPSNSAPLPNPPKAGDFVAAKFSEDGEWYRARVRRNDREAKKAEVVYVDYGNSEVVPYARLRPLGDRFGGQVLRPQAVDAVLSCLQFPSSPEYLADAVEFVGRETNGRELIASVDFVSPEGTLHVTLLDSKEPSARQSVNAEVVAEGLAMVPRKLKGWERGMGELLGVLRKREEEAKLERRGMWEYGDLTEDE